MKKYLTLILGLALIPLSFASYAASYNCEGGDANKGLNCNDLLICYPDNGEGISKDSCTAGERTENTSTQAFFESDHAVDCTFTLNQPDIGSGPTFQATLPYCSGQGTQPALKLINNDDNCWSFSIASPIKSGFSYQQPGIINIKEIMYQTDNPKCPVTGS